MTADGQVRLSFPAFRVFVFGVEVTDDISSCSTNWTDNRAPSTAEFTLANENDRYVTTAEDIAAMYGDIPLDEVELSERQRQVLSGFNDGVDAVNSLASIRDYVAEAARTRVGVRLRNDNLKYAVLSAKFAERTDIAVQQIDDLLLRATLGTPGSAQSASLSTLTALSGQALRYPFQVGQCIFHSNDPVRIFMRDPLRSTDWYYGMSGYVSDWSESVDASGKRIVRVVVEDVLRVFRHSLLATNWALHDVGALTDTDRITLLRTWYTNNFAGLSLPETVFSMVFGSTVTGTNPNLRATTDQLDESGVQGVRPLDDFRIGAYGKKPFKFDADGVGSFNFAHSRIFTYGPEASAVAQSRVAGKDFESIASLEAYQAEVDHKVTLDDILTLSPPDLRSDVEPFILGLPSDPQVAIPEAVGYIGRHPELFPVDFGRIFMLLPGGLGPATSRDILTKDIVQSIATRTQFVKRLAILYNLCERIEFSLYATPKGDVCMEMPLYDFMPDDFGRFAARYTFGLEDTTGWESTFSDEHIRTQFGVTFNLTSQYTLGASTDLWQPPGVVRLDALVPQFGIRPEYVDPPSFLTSEAAAAYYGHIKLNQMNANAWTARVGTVMRMGVGPNRPLWFEARNFIATTRAIQSAITWGVSGGVSQSLSTNYRRGWSGLRMANGRILYEPIGGFASRPLNYALLFQRQEPQTSTKSFSSSGIDAAQSAGGSDAESDAERIDAWASAAERALAEAGINATITSTYRTKEKNAQLLKSLEAKAAAGNAQAATAVGIIRSGGDPHERGLAFDIQASAGSSNDELLSELRSLNSAGFFPPGTKVVDETSGLNHVHVQLSSTSRRGSHPSE